MLHTMANSITNWPFYDCLLHIQQKKKLIDPKLSSTLLKLEFTQTDFLVIIILSFRCLEEGAEDFLLKPVKLSDVKRLRDSLMKVEDLSFTKSIQKRELETENVYPVHSQLKRAKI